MFLFHQHYRMAFRHFGHTEQFKLYDVEDGTIVSSQVVTPMARATAHYPAFWHRRR